jgi:hypothetical protein
MKTLTSAAFLEQARFKFSNWVTHVPDNEVLSIVSSISELMHFLNWRIGAQRNAIAALNLFHNIVPYRPRRLRLYRYVAVKSVARFEIGRTLLVRPKYSVLQTWWLNPLRALDRKLSDDNLLISTLDPHLAQAATDAYLQQIALALHQFIDQKLNPAFGTPLNQLKGVLDELAHRTSKSSSRVLCYMKEAKTLKVQVEATADQRDPTVKEWRRVNRIKK